MAEWLRAGLQNRLLGFESRRGLHHKPLIFQHKLEFDASFAALADVACCPVPTGFARGLLETPDSGPMA